MPFPPNSIGSLPLVISSMKINGPWELLTPSTLTIAPGANADVRLNDAAARALAAGVKSGFSVGDGVCGYRGKGTG